MKSVSTLGDIRGKYVLVRADFNVPIENNIVQDTYRIEVALPTLTFLKDKGARIIIISHVGRDPEATLRPVAEELQKHIDVTFIPSHTFDRTTMKDGDIVLLENLRKDARENTNDETFAQELASLGEIYINEAFPVSHRNAASIVGVPKIIPGYIGLQFEKEVAELHHGIDPEHPFLFILGGAKTETKLPLLRTYLDKADHVFVGGVLANTLYKAKGLSVGTSKVDEPLPDVSDILLSEKLILPEQVTTENGDMSVENISDTESIVDISEASVEKLLPYIEKAKLIVWNGPLGFYEGGYTKGTEKLLELLSNKEAHVIIGGGDTALLVRKKEMMDAFEFVSSGGGAALTYLASGTLVGLEALS